jgi:hypothetical protein
MKLVYRLLIFSLGLVTIMTVFVMAVVDMRLKDRIVQERAAELGREALLIGGQWAAGQPPHEAAARASEALGGRVTLIDPHGIIIADAGLDSGSLTAHAIGTKAQRPEVALAGEGQPGVTIEPADEDGRSDLYVAVKHTKGIVRLGVEMSTFEKIFNQARQDVVTAGLVALLWAMLFAVVFARYLSKPVIQLRDMARS